MDHGDRNPNPCLVRACVVGILVADFSIPYLAPPLIEWTGAEPNAGEIGLAAAVLYPLLPSDEKMAGGPM